LRKGYSTLLAAFVAFSVLTGPRSDSSGSRTPTTTQARPATDQASMEEIANSLYNTCTTDADSATPCSHCSPLCPAKDLLDLIEAHYGTREDAKKPAALGGKMRSAGKSKGAGEAAKSYNPGEHWNVPEGENQRILFVIATVPDPVHTHMSLTFDRTIEAIQKAAQQSGYLFSRATMPWQLETPPDSSDLKVRLAQHVYQGHKEEYPGLMIFRKAPLAEAVLGIRSASAGNSDLPVQANALFVLVVGETPTGGIHKDQYRNALRIILDIRGNSEMPDGRRNLRIAGPAFSGSLASLEQLLNQEGYSGFPRIVIHSGTVSSWVASENFRKFLETNHPQASFATFQESDNYADNLFRCFVVNHGYEAKEIAVLSEDETAYGNLNKEQFELHPPRCGKKVNDSSANEQEEKKEAGEMLYLYFPREISQLRGAYQRDLLTQEGTDNSKKAPRTTLPLNLDTTGSDDDSVPPYARLQTPVSQEAVLLGIVSNLREHHTRFVLIRASNSLDTLFLCRFLRTAYPDGRLVTMGSNLLLQREQDQPSLHGVLQISSYPLMAGIDDIEEHQGGASASHVDRIFSDSYSVGNFNAFLSLLSDVSENLAQAANLPNPENRVIDLPEAAYAQYGWPALSPDTMQRLHVWTPPLWLTVLGRSRFWPVTLLDEEMASGSGQAVRSNLHAVAATPARGKFTPSPPLEWQVFCFLSMCLVFPFSWLMAFPPALPRSELLANFILEEDSLRDKLLFVTGLALLAIQFLFLFPWIFWGGDYRSAPELYLPPALQIVLLTFGCTCGLLRRQSRALARGYFVVAVTALVLFISFRIYFEDRLLPAQTHFAMYRATHLLSGSSFLFPLLFLLVAGLWWGWLGLQGVILRGRKGPILPSTYKFEDPKKVPSCVERQRLKALSKQPHRGLMKALKPFAMDRRVFVPASLALAAMVLVLGRQHSVQGIDGEAFEYVYAGLLFFVLFLLLTLIFRVLLVWMEFRALLRALEDTPLRRSFGKLKGFAWTSLWGLAGSAGSGLINFYRLINRELEILRQLLNLQPTDQPVAESIRLTEEQANTMCGAYEKLRFEHEYQAEHTEFRWRKARQHFRLKLKVFAKSLRADSKRHAGEDSTSISEYDSRSSTTSSTKSSWRKEYEEKNVLQYFHRRLASTTAACLIYLNAQWENEKWPEQEKNEGEAVESAGKDLAEPAPSAVTACVEQYVCLFYLAFILVILQRIQTLVVAIAGLFIFVLASLGSYPFEPHLRLRSLMILLFFLILGVVGFVYAQMFKNSTLSRITKTNPDELGLDFWIRMGTFVVLPALGLLAAQFPEINGVLFSWLEPAMQSLK
jgi:hypothetical protein